MIEVKCKSADLKAIDELIEFQGNLKKLSKENERKLKNSIKQNGFIAPIFIWDNDGEYKILDGHQRLSVLLKMRQDGEDIPLLPVDYIHADNEEDAKKKLLYITSQYGEFTVEGFENFTFDLDDFDNIRLADGEFDLSFMQKDDEAGEGDYEIPDEIETDIKIGDIFQIGEHRLMCGDSTKAEDVERLMDGATPLLMVTDPPYGVEYDPSWRVEAGVSKNTRKMGKVQNDDNADWSAAWKLFVGDVVYVYHGGVMSSVVQTSLEICGFNIRAQIIWAKDRMALSRGDYHWQHEPCWYAVRDGKKGHRTDDRKQTTLWEIPARDDSGHGHGTQKPIECMARPIRNHDVPEVYDPFLGSGTTMVAAQNLGRKCYGMEIDPKYCQIIIDRMKALDENLIIEKNING